MSEGTSKLVARFAAALRGDRRFTADTQHILCELADLINPGQYDSGGGAWCSTSHEFLADLTSCGQRTVRRALAVGVETGYLVPHGRTRFNTVRYGIDEERIATTLQKKDMQRRQCFKRYKAAKLGQTGQLWPDQPGKAANPVQRTGQVRPGEPARFGRQSSSSDTSPIESQTRAAPSAPVCEDEGTFEDFWAAYPSRGGHANPRKPAAAKFAALAKSGVPAGEIVAGAKSYAAHVRHQRIEPKFVAQAITWLNQERWKDKPKPPETDEPLRWTGT